MTLSKVLGQPLHLVQGDSAAGLLGQALHLGRDQILVNEDAVSYGPAQFLTDLGHWRAVRENFRRGLQNEWRDFSFDEYMDNGLLMNVERLDNDSVVVAWVGCGLQDQLMLAWFVFLLDQHGLDPAKLELVQIERLRSGWPVIAMGELNPDDILQLAPEPQPLKKDELEELRRVWAVYTSSIPTELAGYVAGQSMMPVLHRAVSRLVCRYPDLRSGLALQDECLLQYTVEEGPRVVRAVGYTMANLAEKLDPLGDDYLFQRLLAMGDAKLNKPLVSISGDTQKMRECEVVITPFGESVLAGEANHAQENGIDDWIGGVHLSPEINVTFRDGDSLVLPP